MFYLVFFTQLLLITLTTFLVVRLLSLFKSNTFAADNVNATAMLKKSAVEFSSLTDALNSKRQSAKTSNLDARIKSLTQAQIFSSAQLLSVRQNGLIKSDTHLNDEDNWLVKAIVCYLIGASTQIARHFECADLDIDDIIMFVLTKNLKLSYESAEMYIRNDFLTDAKETYKQALFVAGKQAASQWLNEKKVDESQRLFHSVNEWGLIA